MFASRRSRRSGAVGSSGHSTIANSRSFGGQFPTRLNFYSVPPLQELSVDEFESFALDRLKILKALETAQLRNRSDDELRHVLSDAESRYLAMHPNGNNPADIKRLDDERRKDNISHFILRLAFARSEEQRAWFVRMESLLFRLRFEREMSADKSAFLRTLDLEIEEISPEEKSQLLPELLPATLTLPMDAENEHFYTLSWTRVLDLVARRRCLLKEGTAYIAGRDHFSIVLADFKSNLERHLELASRFLPRMDEDERLAPVLNNMGKQYLGGKNYSFEGGDAENGDGTAVTSEQIEELAEKHFPPCMRHLQDTLSRDSHLRHFGRLQYGLFLKGIGLSVEEALIFWRRSFDKVTESDFNKQYAYNVRYNYGLEGRRANYRPYSCTKVINGSAPGPGDNHGCPFRHFSSENLRTMLVRYGAQDGDAAQISDLARKGHCQVACTRFYEATRGSLGNENIDHPNAFYQLSKKGASSPPVPPS